MMADGARSDRPTERVLAPLRGLLPLLVLLAVWEITGTPRSPYFPAPSSWWSALLRLQQAKLLVPAVLATVRTVSLGLLAATMLGVLLGIAVGRRRHVDHALNPTFEFVRAMPPAALVPVATLLLGFNETMKVTVVTITAVWAILLNVRSGARHLDPILLDTARSLRLGSSARLFKVICPALMPSVLLGIRVAAPIAVVITLLAEFLTQVDGVGALIADAQRTFQPARVYGLIVVAGGISLLVNSAVVALEARVLRRRRAG